MISFIQQLQCLILFLLDFLFIGLIFFLFQTSGGTFLNWGPRISSAFISALPAMNNIILIHGKWSCSLATDFRLMVQDSINKLTIYPKIVIFLPIRNTSLQFLKSYNEFADVSGREWSRLGGLKKNRTSVRFWIWW